MSSPLNHSQKLLELATSRELPLGTELDAETSQLRDGWLALGQTLEDSGKQFDFAQLAQSVVADGRVQIQTGEQLPSSSKPLWRSWLALAASVLLAAGWGGWWWSHRSPADSVQQPEQVATQNGSRQSSPVTPSPEPVTPHNNSDEPLPVLEFVSWNDSLDEDIASASEQLVQVRYGWNSRRHSSEVVQEQLEEFGESLSVNSL